jgi:hypothetical protein
MVLEAMGLQARSLKTLVAREFLGLTSSTGFPIEDGVRSLGTPGQQPEGFGDQEVFETY